MRFTPTRTTRGHYLIRDAYTSDLVQIAGELVEFNTEAEALAWIANPTRVVVERQDGCVRRIRSEAFEVPA